MAVNYPKKIDCRLTDEEFDKLVWLTNKLGAKKSSYARESIKMRADKDLKLHGLEEEYEQFKKGDKAELRTRDIQKLIIGRMLKNNPKCTVSQAGANYQSMKKYFTSDET